jgi:sugar phosphate isomerase/epimerase
VRFARRGLVIAVALALCGAAAAAEKWQVGSRDGGYLRGMGCADVWSAMDALDITRIEVAVSGDLSCPGLFENGTTPYRIGSPEDCERLRQKLAEKKKSISAFCAGVGLEKGKSDEANLERIDRIAAAAALLGRPVIMIPVGARGFSDEELVERAVAFVKGLAQIAERHNVQLTLENLGHYWNRREVLEPVLKSVPTNRVGLALDITNMYWFGHPLSHLYELAETFAPYVRYVHVKSIQYPEDKREVRRTEGWEYGKYTAPVRQGDIDFHRIITLLGKAGCRGDLTLEDDSLGKFDADGRKKVMRDNVQFLRDIISRME